MKMYELSYWFKEKNNIENPILDFVNIISCILMDSGFELTESKGLDKLNATAIFLLKEPLSAILFSSQDASIALHLFPKCELNYLQLSTTNKKKFDRFKELIIQRFDSINPVIRTSSSD